MSQNKMVDNKDILLSVFGAYIRRKRQEHGLTLEKLADEIYADEKHLGRIERGEKEPKLFIIAKLHRRLSLNSKEYIAEYEKALKEHLKKE